MAIRPYRADTLVRPYTHHLIKIEREINPVRPQNRLRGGV